jgi:mono/diheme cytochrome c family protein
MRLSKAPLVAGVTFALVSTGSAYADAAKVEAGATIYGDYCSSCHGEQLRNTSGGVTFDLRRLRPDDRDRFTAAVLDGKGPMPPWRGVLRIEQVEAIWAYIRATVDR